VNAAEVACRLVDQISQRALAIQQKERDEGFYVPYSTLATCRFNSGHASNVIPESAEFDFDLRYLPKTDPDSVIAPIHEMVTTLESQMRQREAGSRIDLERRTSVPALSSELSASDVIRWAVSAGATLGPHADYTTEGGLYQAAGIPTIICGPGDISQAHTADEFILKSELAACESFLQRLLLPEIRRFFTCQNFCICERSMDGESQYI
jgi:acetylornithine deacetylase